MTRKIISTGLAIGAVLALSGCGSSNDSTPTAATGTAYYIDSAVSGVNYKCGSQEGTTGADGEFTFEEGAGCTFYLGDIELRSVDAESLVDGGEVRETDLEIARILQSLDSDGKPENGITIDAKIVQAMEEAGITKLPDTKAGMEELMAVVEAAGGTVVSEEDTLEHMFKSQVMGKTLYQHCKDSKDEWIASLTFGTDGKITMVDQGETETAEYRIEGNVIYTAEEGGEEGHAITEITDTYVKVNETSGEVTMFYFTKEAAQAAPAMDCGGDTDDESFTFSPDYLNGKSLYFVQYDDFGYEDVGMKWNMARMDFTASTFAWTEYDTADTETHTFHYSVNADGNIVYYYDNPAETTTISSPEVTNDYIKVCEEGDCNTYLFFDEAKAKAFRDSKNQ